MADVRVKLSRSQVRQVLAGAVQVVTGTASDPTGLMQGLYLAVGVEALAIVRQAYLDRARGRADESGLSWAPLKRKTIAGRRHPGLRRKKAGERPRGLLTAEQDRRWRKLYAQMLRRFDGDRAHAAAYAWTVLLAEGADTILERYGGTQVEIGRDTGVLYNSLSPGIPANVLRAEAGAVVIGTNVPYAEPFHRRRPLWPDPERWPAVWTDRLANVALAGLAKVIELMLGRGR